MTKPEFKRGRGRPRGTHDLNTLSGLRKEHIDVHRLMKAGKMDVTMACKQIWSLSMLKELIIATKIEPLLAEMEMRGGAIDITPTVMTWPPRQLNS